MKPTSLQWLWATGCFPTSASPSWQFSIGDASRLVLMWMGLNHMVSLSLSLTVLKNVVLSTLAANWSEPIVDSHHHQQVIFPLRAWLLIMYRKSKWKCGYNLAVLGHGEFTSARLFQENKHFFLHLNFSRWKYVRNKKNKNKKKKPQNQLGLEFLWNRLFFYPIRFWLRLVARSTSVEQYKLLVLV